MSLDVYLNEPTARVPRAPRRIFIRENGQQREITREEWDERFPGREPVVLMDDDEETTEVYWANITHNLGKMAGEAGLYLPLWRPEEMDPPITRAGDLIPHLERGLTDLQIRPAHFRQFNPANGWGDYDGLVRFVADYLAACRKHPEAEVRVWR